MRKLVLGWLALLFVSYPFTAIPQQNRPQLPEPSSNQLPPDTVIVLERGACEHRCPVYRIVVFADGDLLRDGIAYVSRLGVVRSRVEPGVIKEWLADVKKMNFFDLKNGYGVFRQYGISNDFQVDEKCDSEQPDAPLATLSISSGGRSKTVIYNRSCKGPTYDGLRFLENKFVAITHSDRWIKGVSRRNSALIDHQGTGLLAAIRGSFLGGS
jgi:Domain of unknown function (DUF6438)